jgi:hypothetical protein
MKKILLFLIPVLFFSCQKKENSTVSNVVETPAPIVKKEDKKDNKQIGDTIAMNFPDEKNMFKAEATFDSLNSKVYVKFKNEDLGELNASIIPEPGKGNIRFNQIIFPDKSSDGPFGMDLKMPIKQKGNYILVIGHSLMAENPYTGKFKVQMEIKKSN